MRSNTLNIETERLALRAYSPNDAANLSRLAGDFDVAKMTSSVPHPYPRLSAEGYIMLAETIKFGNEAGGLGNIINMSMRRNLRENVVLVLLIIPLVALAIDRGLFWIQRELFPHVFGGRGRLNRCVRWLLHTGEDLKHALLSPRQSSR